MKERPILFSGPLVRAILAGTKTQTRRPVKVRKSTDHLVLAGPCAVTLCPFGGPGDRLWVRETWAPRDSQALREKDRGHVFCRADDARRYETDGRWRPSIHMPRWASRLTLEVTDVRVERLQDISEEDARAEGVEAVNGHPELGALIGAGPSCREGFAQKWREIYGPGSWEANGWVWVVGFKRI